MKHRHADGEIPVLHGVDTLHGTGAAACLPPALRMRVRAITWMRA
jgi:hypothetical protein